MTRFVRNRLGVTLIELLVVLLIIAILSTMAVGVYTGQVERARYARARAEIRSLSVAVQRYEVDTGQFPPSGSLSDNSAGCGWLQLALMHSLSGSVTTPADFRWQGPYIDFDASHLGDISGGPVTGTTAQADVQFLDPWKSPYIFYRSSDYSSINATQLPASSPYAATETYYNPTTFQIISNGRDRATEPAPNRGLASDDVSNFLGSEL